jgi:hypothetical protein
VSTVKATGAVPNGTTLDRDGKSNIGARSLGRKMEKANKLETGEVRPTSAAARSGDGTHTGGRGGSEGRAEERKGCRFAVPPEWEEPLGGVIVSAARW